MKKHVAMKLLAVFTLALLSLVAVNRSSGQGWPGNDFDCRGASGGVGDPTPTATPVCHDEYYDVYETNCDYSQGVCCQDHYFVTEHWCYGLLESTSYEHVSHSCYEI
jgi:hypothetical protein